MIRLALPIAALAAFLYMWWGHWDELTPATWSATTIALACAIAVVFDRTIASSVVLLGALAGFSALRAADQWPFAWDAMGDRLHAGAVTAVVAVGAIGLARGWPWARWMIMALGAATALGSGLQARHQLGLEAQWIAALGVIGGITLVVALSRRELVARFHRDRHAVWASRDAVVRWSRLAMVTCAAAGSMLVIYTMNQFASDRTTIPSLVLAPILFAGAGLLALRKTIGLVVLAIAGVALLAHTAAALAWGADPGMVEYYAAFWLPAGACATVAGIVALRRAW
jgi:hypothetical protein